MIMTENSNEIYIGSTTQTLIKRLRGHETHFRTGYYCSSQEILKQGNYKIVLIKNFACNSLFELETEETKFQKDLVCVNKKRARITDEDKRQYQIDNRERAKQYYKHYYIDNIESVKQYRIDNKESIKQNRIDNKERAKQYYIDNKERFKQYNKKYRQRKKQEREAEKQQKKIIFKIKK
jgi:hypothetical protein